MKIHEVKITHLIKKIDEIIEGMSSCYISHKITSEKEHGKWEDDEEVSFYKKYIENRQKLEDVRNFVKYIGDKLK